MHTQWFLRLPIRIKLYAIVLVASALALLLAPAASFIIQQHLIRKQLRDELQTLATVISENSRAGIVFEDDQVTGKERAVCTAQVEQHAVITCDRDNLHFGNDGSTGFAHLIAPEN